MLHKFTWLYMRRFALGCLGYTPERFGAMIVGDFLDAMAGYNEGETERIKSVAELIRTSTTILLNIQLAKTDRIKAQELWSFPWDKTEEGAAVVEVIDDQEKKRREDEMEKILNRISANGNSNNKP